MCSVFLYLFNCMGPAASSPSVLPTHAMKALRVNSVRKKILSTFASIHRPYSYYYTAQLYGQVLFNIAPKKIGITNWEHAKSCNINH